MNIICKYKSFLPKGGAELALCEEDSGEQEMAG